MPERPDEFEEAWARIVAELTSEDSASPDTGSPAGTAAEHPDSEATGSPADPVERTGPATGTTQGGTADPGAGLQALFEPLRRTPQPEPAAPGTGDPGAFVDNWQDEGHFTPPPPPELPEGTPLKRLAWVGLLGGPATLALIAVTGWDAPPVVGIGAGLATLAGFVTLVWHLPDSREDGWDDGARL